MKHALVCIGRLRIEVGMTGPGIEPSRLEPRDVDAYECPCGLVSWFPSGAPFSTIACPAASEPEVDTRDLPWWALCVACFIAGAILSRLF